MGFVIPTVDPVSRYEICLLAGRPTSLVHIVDCLGRAKNELRHKMKSAETDLAAALADEFLSQDVSIIASLREQMAEAHGCRRILRTFATEILASDADDRDFDESVLFASNPSAGLEELESLRESRRLPGAHGSREGRNYDDLSRVRNIFEGARRENRSITKDWIRKNLPPGSSVARREIPLLDSTVFIGVPGEMIQLTTVEVMAILDVATGGGCYPESESESEDDESGAYDAEPGADMDVDEVGEAVAIDAAPEAYVCDMGSGVVLDSKPFKAFNGVLNKVRYPKGDCVVIVGTVSRKGTGILKSHPSFAGEFGRYVASVGLGRFYVVKVVSKTVSRHTIDVSLWSEAQRESAISFIETYRGPILSDDIPVLCRLACADSDSDDE